MKFIKNWLRKENEIKAEKFYIKCKLSPSAIGFYNELQEDSVIFKYCRGSGFSDYALLNLFKLPFYDKKENYWILGHFMDTGEDVCELDEEDTVCLDPNTKNIIISSFVFEDRSETQLEKSIDDFIDNLKSSKEKAKGADAALKSTS